MRVLVCGGRDFADEKLLNYTLDKIHVDRMITKVIEGGARGADTLARLWVSRTPGIDIQTVKAQWEKFGKAAGAIRNREMLYGCNPQLVVAFPGGRGTADMVRIARAAGVEVLEVEGRDGDFSTASERRFAPTDREATERNEQPSDPAGTTGDAPRTTS